MFLLHEWRLRVDSGCLLSGSVDKTVHIPCPTCWVGLSAGPQSWTCPAVSLCRSPYGWWHLTSPMKLLEVWQVSSSIVGVKQKTICKLKCCLLYLVGWEDFISMLDGLGWLLSERFASPRVPLSFLTGNVLLLGMPSPQSHGSRS
jgi:hypothetical protein